MADIITPLINALLNPIIDSYAKMLEGFPLNFLSYIVSALLLAVVMQAIFMLIPPLKTFIEGIMFPFRILHVWLHMQETRKIINERTDGTRSKNTLQFVSYFSTGYTAKVEKSSLAITGLCSPKEASRIANAPLKGALVLLLTLTLLTPFLRTSLLGVLIHLYMFIGIATTSFPSGSDYKFTYNMILVNSDIPSSWIIVPIASFSTAFIVFMALTGNILFAIVFGVAASTMGTWAVMTYVVKKLAKKDEEPKIFDYNESFSDETAFEPVMGTSDPYSNSYLLFQLESDIE